MYADVDYFFNFVFALLASFTRLLSLIIHEAQPKPYMDEIFHVPQVQAYCNHSFSTWDPMITTLPGLYLFSVGIIKPLEYALKIDLCQTYYLRIINIGFCIGVFYISSMIVMKKQDEEGWRPKLATLSGLSISLFPVLYFFNFLYYTDLGSTFFVLFAYLLHIHNCHKTSAFIGAISILFRQTNVVWVMFMGWLAAIPILSRGKKSEHSNGQNEFGQLNDFKANLHFVIKSVNKFNFKPLINMCTDVLHAVWPYLATVVLFVIFLILNDGIVLGAKSDHEAGLHLCQILYFSLFSFAFLFPLVPHKNIFKNFLYFLKKRFILAIMSIISILLVVHFTTTAHRYLLSDNRHYTFYIWKNVFQRHQSVRYLLAPFYLFSIVAIWLSLNSRSALWKMGFFGCLTVALAPSSLLELRYFIVPHLLLRLNVNPQPGFVRISLEMAVHLLVNAFTIYVFLYKPFSWSESGELQRFMY